MDPLPPNSLGLDQLSWHIYWPQSVREGSKVLERGQVWQQTVGQPTVPMDNMGAVKVETNDSTINEEAGLPESDGTAVEVVVDRTDETLSKNCCGGWQRNSPNSSSGKWRIWARWHNICSLQQCSCLDCVHDLVNQFWREAVGYQLSTLPLQGCILRRNSWLHQCKCSQHRFKQQLKASVEKGS